MATGERAAAANGVAGSTGASGSAGARLQDICEQTGLALSTVSLALRGMYGVSPETRERVLQAARELGYTGGKSRVGRRPRAGGSLRRSRPAVDDGTRATLAAPVTAAPRAPVRRRIGIVYPAQEGLDAIARAAHYGRYLRGIQAAAPELLLDLVFLPARNGELDDVVEYVLGGPGDGSAIGDGGLGLTPEGLILVGMGGEADASQRTLQRNIPVVLLSRYAARLSCSWVSVDHIRASEVLVTHLFEQGYRRVVFVADQGGRMAWQHYRREGFKDALRRQGLSPVPKDEVVVEQADDALDRLEGIIRAGAATAGEALPPASIALFAVSDSLGVGLLNGLRERGLEAPRDYGIAGYDNLAAELPGGTDRLTSIGFPREQIGALACRVVRDVCDIPNLERQHIFITPELHARATSAGPGNTGTGTAASKRPANTPIRKSGVQSAKELASL